MLGGATFLVAGCGAGKHATAPESRLERSDLVAVSRVLRAQEPSVHNEVAATKTAWPLVINGLPADVGKLPRSAVHNAAGQAAALRLPALFEEQQAASLTGPATSLAGTFRNYVLLTTRGWRAVNGAVEQAEHVSTEAARFARANVALYIESIYDAHFALAQIGKQMPIDYQRLGGAAAFGASLTPAEIDALAASYSEANDRLQPRARVRLGS